MASRRNPWNDVGLVLDDEPDMAEETSSRIAAMVAKSWLPRTG